MPRQLLILPGWGGTRESWRKFSDLAKDDFQVICLELPCFGAEPCPAEAWGVKEYADFVSQKIKELNLIKPVLLGHSFGGQVAAYLAAREPQLISRLVLSGAAALRPKRGLRKAVLGILAKCGKAFFNIPPLKSFSVPARKYLYKLAGALDYEEASGIKREIFKKIICQDLTEELKKIKTPTLVVWGTLDSYVPLTSGKKIAELIPGARLEIISGGKHGLHLQLPEKLYEIIKNFLK